MGLRNRLVNVTRNAAGVAGDVLSGWAEDDGFWKAKADPEKDTKDNRDLESQERGPGGDNKDQAADAPPPDQPAASDPKSLFWDPYSIIEQLGFKEKPSNISYGTLKAMVWKTPIIQAVINTRIDQVAAFCRPSRSRYDMGFKFQKRGDPYIDLTPEERKWGDQMSTIIMRTGVTTNPRGRDNFETFTRKVIRDSLIYDQLAFESVANRLGQPAEWYAVDSSTIRIADSATVYLNEDDNKDTRYVQIYDGMIITEYNQEELAFGVRNPSSDIRLFGYGVSELEMLMQVVTALLWGWEYNVKSFSQGSVHKGILNFKGAIPDKQLKAFRRHWYQMLSGVENAWRTPITNSDDLQWISMHSNARDMEFPSWFDFLIKLTCALYRMDPVEVNFKYGNVGQKGALSETSNKEKIVESKERGLRPILSFYQDLLNRYIIWPINEDMELVFAGLDAMTKEEAADLNAKRVKTTHTVNELRAEDGLDAIEGGDTLLDPTWAQQQNMAAQQAMGEQGGFPDFGEVDEDNGEEDDDKKDPDFRRMAAALEEDEEDEEDESTQKKSPMQKSGKKINGKQPRFRVDVRL